MRLQHILILSSFLAFGAASTAHAQQAVSSGAPVVERFDGFLGAGFTATPAPGQLDSDEWRVTGLTDGDTSFGGSFTTGDYARGTSTGGTSTGGAYAFDVGVGGPNPTLGFQPTGGDASPGAFELRVQNGTGAPLTQIEVSYTFYVYNDQARASSMDVEVERETMPTPVAAPSLSATTPEAADGAPAWVGMSLSATIDLSATPVAAGDNLIVRFTTDDVSGSGSRDEIAIDDVTVSVPAAMSTCGDGMVEGAEACDDGNTTTETECPYGTASCMACSDDCQMALSLTGRSCGDGTLDAGDGEVCDDGNTTTETSCPA
ncbi:MAG: hypothetical protein RLO52_31355, partial [Sandaracinaceae bacterium]